MKNKINDLKQRNRQTKTFYKHKNCRIYKNNTIESVFSFEFLGSRLYSVKKEKLISNNFEFYHDYLGKIAKKNSGDLFQ